MAANLYRKLQVLIVAVILTVGLGTSALATPQLTQEDLTTIADDHIVITWVTSNEPSTSGIEYGIGSTTLVTEESTLTYYHYLVLDNLYPNTNYSYRIFSKNVTGQTTYGKYRNFKTLEPPSGQLLFAFATLSDLQVATDVANTTGARGRPYPTTEAILQAAVDAINLFNPSFTVVKGDLIDHRTSDPSAQAGIVISKLSGLSSQVFPLPGNHEKETWTSKTGGWYDVLLKPIFDLAAFTPPPGFGNYNYDPDIIAPAEEDSIYNYSFDYGTYHFIILDSVRQRDINNRCKGHVDTAWFAGDLAANTDKKSFIFMHYVITPEAPVIPDEVVKEVTNDPVVDWEKIDLDNRSDFLTVLSSYESNIAGVFMGHIHDNFRYYLSGFDFPFVRTAATVQFPVGFNIYKVYSNGYMQNFYKIPYYSEIAREQITDDAGYSDIYWEQLSLGSNYDRNFVVTYSDVNVPPFVKSSAPLPNSTNVALNQPVIITFTKPMATAETQNAVTFSPDTSGKSYSWSDSDTILNISHDNFSASTTYTVTVGVAAESKDNLTILSPYSFSFTTGTSAATAAPEASIDKITNDITDDPTPTFTGIATDEISTISNIEYRISNAVWSEWRPCTPLDGAFDSNEESFTFTITPEVTRGQHGIEIRCTNAAGVTTQTGFASYTFYFVGDRPEITLKTNGKEIISGDPIKSNPSFEVTVITDKGLNLSNLKFYLNQNALTPSSTNQQNNSTITYAFYHPTLTDGTYDVRVEAIDNQGNGSTKEAEDLLVQATGDVKIFGFPLNYPNPFDPGTQTTTISYTLSRAGNITIRIFDIAGNLIAKKSFSSGEEGGKTGYNEVSWDGRSDSGDYVGNGIYIYLIIADGKVVQNGKGKMTVFKR